MAEVRDTLDYQRIANLPRRRLSLSDAEAWARTLTDELRLPGSSEALRPWQGYSLAEFAANDGAFLGLGVGHGKTLITYLAPTMVGSLRPLLIVPGAGLVEKTYEDFADYLPHWRQPLTMPRVITLQSLSSESGQTLLDDYRPDLIMIDECDELANLKSSAAARLDRYIRGNDGDVRVLCCTGTPGRKSILNYWHLLCWCLRDGAPVPLMPSEASLWALAIDEARGRNPGRVRPGVLGATVELARRWYRDRLIETPGVVIVDGDSCTAPLTIRTRLAREDPKLNKTFDRFHHTLETPGGEIVSDPLSRWRIDGQFGCGLYTYFDPPPPEDWRLARRALAGFVRKRIDQSRRTTRPLDSKAMVMRRYTDHPIVTEWRRVKDTYDTKKHTRVAWITDSTIHSVRDWLAEDGTPGIVWSGSVEFGAACALATRLPYYGPEGRDANGVNLRNADASRSLVASWHANKRGFNLQAWTRQLIVMPPQSAKYLEQIFGRSHRAGQEEHVIVDVLATSGGTLDAFETAIDEAGFNLDTVSMTQKVLRATIQRCTPRITDANRYRWAQRDEDDDLDEVPVFRFPIRFTT